MRRIAMVAVAALSITAAPVLAQGYSGQLFHNHSPSQYYTNTDGNRVHKPTFDTARPAGATARCADGSWSFSQHARGTCSHHGGVSSR